MKPLKDTKLGKWLKEKAPKVLETVGDIIPGRDPFEVIADLVKKSPDVPPEQKLEFTKMQYEFETEWLKIDMQDRASARSRETDFVKSTGHIDWMMTITGSLILMSFIGLLYVITFKEIPAKNEHLVINAIGVIEGLVGLVVGYYYGSSAGSRIKDMKKGDL